MTIFLASCLLHSAALTVSGIPLQTGGIICLIFDLISQTEYRALNKQLIGNANTQAD